LWIKPLDDEGFAARAEGIRTALTAQAQNQVINDWYEAKLAEAKVEDMRYSQR
jgi:hypothetical protein